MAGGCTGRDPVSIPTPGKADTGVGIEAESRPDITRLSDSSGDTALTKAGLHPMPDDSHGACNLIRQDSEQLVSSLANSSV